MFDLIPLEQRKKKWFEEQRSKHLYLSHAWLTCLAQTYTFEVLLLVDELDEPQTAFCKLDDMMGKRLVSLPFSDYMPYGERDPGYFEQVFHYCTSKFPDYEITLKTDRESTLLTDKFKLKKEAVYHTIDLSSEAKQSSSFKRGVKQAIKNGIETRVSTSMFSLIEFYKMYNRLRFDKFQIIPQPFSFFEILWENTIKQKNIYIFESLLDEKVIASMIVLTYDKTAYYKYGASDMEHLSLKPNNLLFHDLIKHFKSEGFDQIDLGLSGSGDSYAGLRRWKSSMGGDEKPISYWASKTGNSEIPASVIDKNKATIKGITDAIVAADLSVQQTSLLSEQLYPLLA